MNTDDFQRQVLDSLARLEERQRGGLTRLTAVEDDIFGNGDAGLKERVATLEAVTPKSGGTKLPSTIAGLVAAAFVAGAEGLKRLL